MRRRRRPRSQQVRDELRKSIIDPAYTNCGHTLTTLEIVPVGDSDNPRVVICKIIKIETLRMHNYRLADLKAILTEIATKGINELVPNIHDLKKLL